MAEGGPAIAGPGGIRLFVRLTPKGGRDAVEGVTEIDGRTLLKVRVASPPVAGAANAALIKLLAKHFGVSKSALRLAAGETARIKTIEIAGNPTELLGRIPGVGQ